MKETKKSLVRLTLSSMLLAMALLLPFLTGQIPEIGNALCPMHFPVLICGYICGPLWGAAVGFIAPLLRSVIFQMPPMFPAAVSMAVEMAVYGLMTGLLHRAFPKKLPFRYLTLIISMIAGRLAWGTVRFLIAGLSATEFSFAAFAAGAVTTAIPGIILQIVIIPPAVLLAEKWYKRSNQNS